MPARWLALPSACSNDTDCSSGSAQASPFSSGLVALE
jgi:hypothetical protein